MFAVLPLLLLAVAVVLVVAMPWHRPHPNHLFFLELLEKHLQEEPALLGDSANAAKSDDGTAAA